MRLVISETFTCPMWVTTTDVEIKGCICILAEKLCNLRSHVHGTPGIDFRFKTERVNTFRFNVFLSETCCRKSVCLQNFWYRLCMFVCAKSVNAVAMSILSMCMTMLPRKNARPTHRARGTCTKCVVKHNPAFRKGINVRGSDNIISIAFRDAAPIVGNDEHNAFIGIVHDSPLHWDKRVICLRY